MWDSNGAYPMVVLDPTAGSVVGELFEIDEAIFAEVLAALDDLEVTSRRTTATSTSGSSSRSRPRVELSRRGST
jgi:gamma-glutamylcyclotransferase (GGCT)/AIG2-like uncharacterized protein YtfP